MRRVLPLILFAVLSLASPALARVSGNGGSGFLVVVGGGPARDFPTSFETKNISARLTGDLAVSFHGDPATGCARRGLCGYSGTLVWSPANPSSLEIQGTTFGRRTVLGATLYIDDADQITNGGGTTSVDTRDAGTTCADAAYTGSFITLPVTHGRTRVELTESNLPSVFESRCAEPTQGDLATALPSATVPLSSLMRGTRTINLHSQKRFASHGFAGTVTSTLSMSLGRPGRWSRAKLKIVQQRQHEVTIEYRAGLTGQLIAAVNGDANQGLCGPLGACGVSGTVSLAGRTLGTARFSASGPTKYSYSQLLGWLLYGSAPKNVYVAGDIRWPGEGTTTTRLGRPGAPCVDSTRFSQQEGVLNISERRIGVQYTINDETSDPFRTRCPGPFSPAITLASGHAPRSILGRPAATIPFTGAGAFTDDGYFGSISSTFRVALSDRRVTRRKLIQVEASN